MIETALKDELKRYIQFLRKALPARIVGAYIHGSATLGAFHERLSDIDLVVTVRGALSDRALRMVKDAHSAFCLESPWGKRLDTLIAALPIAPLSPNEMPGCHAFRKGRYMGKDTLPATALCLLHERGIVLHGAPCASVFPVVDRATLNAEMHDNLTRYWNRKSHQPYLFLFDEMVDFAVCTLPRIHHTLHTGAIIAKPQALDLCDQLFPEWTFLTNDVRTRRNGCRARLSPVQRIRRAAVTLRFIRSFQ